jgi:hypothetical protein
MQKVMVKRVPCKYGDVCRFNMRGVCNFYHENKGADIQGGKPPSPPKDELSGV